MLVYTELGLFESYNSIKDIKRGIQVQKNHNNDNYNLL